MSASIRFISAGAGSGKTYKLTEILHELLATKKVAPAGVIATTFTKKAAAELRERVRGSLVEKGQHGLATAIGQARIGTVNSVCGGLLSRFAFEAGLPPEQRVLDPERAGQILKEAMDFVAEGPTLEELLKIARRLGLTKGRLQIEDPWEKAFREIVDQARANAIDPETLRGFGNENADRLLSYFPRASALDLDDALRLAIEVALPALRQAQANAAKPRKNTGDYIALLESIMSELPSGELPWSQWNKLANSEPQKTLLPTAQPVTNVAAMHPAHPRLQSDLRQYLKVLFDLAADALDAYAERKRQLCAVDFADQERLLLDILDSKAVEERLAEEIDLLMVDEFQDTSPIQLALFLKLARLAKHVVWVGDVKQAIYGFRGGDAALMQAVLAALPTMGGSKETLQYSFRSRPPLVALMNELFGTAFAGLAPKEVQLVPKRLEYTQAAAVEDWQLEGSVAADRYQAIASGIAALVNEGFLVKGRDDEVPRPIRLGDIAILARSNATVQAIAGALTGRRIAAATKQPGLLSRPEIVLALACLRRLNDERDTIATAEIVSLAECEDPDHWLSDRLAWIDAKGDARFWRDKAGDAVSPVFAAIQELRVQRPVLSPREAVDLVIARCGLSKLVLQWQTSAERARMRLKNLDRLMGYAGEYEEMCRANREAATLSGLLLWFQELEGGALDHLPEGGGDAVQVMTHHTAKGLEWPVVILVDLAGDVRDSTWNTVRAESRRAFDAGQPLAGRFLRYWPWAYGAQEKVPIADSVAASPAGVAIRAAALEEDKRLLYVSLTRARDLVVLALAQKQPDGEWMRTIGLAQRLPAAGARRMVLQDGTRVPFQRRMLNAGSADLPSVAASANLRWYEAATSRTEKLPLTVSPSSAGESAASILETVRIGPRLDTHAAEDRSMLGEAIHACIAADLIAGETGLPPGELLGILERYDMSEVVSTAAVKRQLQAIRAWLHARWPDAVPWVEIPVDRVLPNGQRVAGRIDLLLRTMGGWILLDHKSTPQGQDRWAALAQQYGGQLAVYRETVAAVTGVPVLETWLLLPVAGAAVRVGQETEAAGDPNGPGAAAPVVVA